MNYVKYFFRAATVGLLLVVSLPLAHAKDDWLPISPEDLALKDNPAQPGSSAMILYRSVERNDQMGSEREYIRIKIFTEEGKQYADVSMPPFDREFKVSGVQGRTIHPDGTIVPFSGQVFEKVVERSQGVKVVTKSFTMPDVTPGSIIEYRYTRYWEAYNPSTHEYYYFPRSEWTVQGPLYQRVAHFEFIPARPDMFSYRVQAMQMPATAKLNNQNVKHLITLDLSDVPAFEEEPYMPPPMESEMRVLFFYAAEARIPEGEEYWRMSGKVWYGIVESFMDKKGALSRAVASMTSPSDAPEVKLHKLYAFVQTFDNLTFEPKKLEKYPNFHGNKNVEDVLNNKLGYRNDLNRTFVALVRNAGMDATLVKVTERDEALLHREWPSFSQLTYEIASVKLNGQTLYLDPGSLFCPFGILPWEDTGVLGLVWDKNMPTWVSMPIPDPSASALKRIANLKLADDGTLTGDVIVTYAGEYAYLHRMWARNEDDAEKKKSMERVMENWLPMKGDIAFVGVNDWKSSELPLVVTYKITIPGYASQAGRRLLLPGTLFAGSYKSPFTATKRIHPIFMEYEFDDADDVKIALPASLKVENLPKSTNDKNGVAELSATYVNENGTLHFQREFKFKTAALEQKYYTALKQYFQAVQAGTDEQAVLTTAN